MGINCFITVTIVVFYYFACSVLNTAAQNFKKNALSDISESNDSYLEESIQNISDGSKVSRKLYEGQEGGVTERNTGCYRDSSGLCIDEDVTDETDFVTSTNLNLENSGVTDSVTETGTLVMTSEGDTSNDDFITGSATVSVSNNVSGSTIQFTNITTTTDITTETAVDFKYSSGLDYCDCDMYKHECDINCCCDPDCTPKDKSSFVGCFPVRSSDVLKSADDYSDRFCYSTRFIYTSDKTVSRIVERNRNGLFCIAFDNLPVGILYENVAPIKSVDEFDRKLKSSKRGIFGWSHLHSHAGDTVDQLRVGVIFPVNVTEYKYGDYIWTFTNYSESYLRPLFVPLARQSSQFVPSLVLSFTERKCHLGRPIQFLKDDLFSCLRHMPKNKDDCEMAFRYIDLNFYYNKNLRILTAPQTILNDTSISDYCSDEICSDVNLLVCKDSNFLLCNEEVALSHPKFYESVRQCSNVVKNVRYLFHLNGVKNISKVEIYIHLVNLSASNMKSNFLRQRFEIKFYRPIFNKSQGMLIPVKIPLEKSGTPGYAFGKPIITGKKADLLTGNERENYSSQYIILRSDKKHWLGLPTVVPSSGGDCDFYVRRNIMFLENTKSECLLRVPFNCESSRDKTLGILLGEYYSSNVTERRGINIYVSSYGDPDPADPDGWIAALIRKTMDSPKNRGLFRGRERCNDVFTDVTIKILYSYVGPVSRPQAKVVGMLISLSFDDNSVIQIGNDFEIFRMTSMVKFVDISKPDDAVIKFADPPVYEIKLPQDFFYPFLSSSFKASPSFYSILFMVFLNYVSFKYPFDN